MLACGARGGGVQFSVYEKWHLVKGANSDKNRSLNSCGVDDYQSLSM